MNCFYYYFSQQMSRPDWVQQWKVRAPAAPKNNRKSIKTLVAKVQQCIQQRHMNRIQSRRTGKASAWNRQFAARTKDIGRQWKAQGGGTRAQYLQFVKRQWGR
jgi:hypothetical protein